MKTIKFDTAEEFYNAIYALTVKGLSFDAYVYNHEYSIELTGGY